VLACTVGKLSFTLASTKRRSGRKAAQATTATTTAATTIRLRFINFFSFEKVDLSEDRIMSNMSQAAGKGFEF
jgi:hypothetical protein